jgi:anaerobic magnesium-protoporphyrin IX monomethyl ester cyclase
MNSPRRILLIRPHRNSYSHSLMPPLGLMYLAAHLRRNGDVDVRIIDMPATGTEYHEISQIIGDDDPDWVGISALTFESEGLHQLAALAKAVRPDLPVVVGGPHPSAYTRQVMEDASIDYAVIGEGEITAGRLDRALAEGDPVGQIQGLAWREHGELRINPHGDYIDDLEALPFPAWDLIDIPRYRSFDRMSHSGIGDYMVVFTSRACPFKCTYCHEMFGKSFRKRSPEHVLAELRELHDRYGIREFEIIDDIFNCDQQRAKQIFQMIIDSDMDLLLTFPNGIRGDAIDEEFLRLARQAGVVFIAFAIETATPRLQKMLRKNIRLEKIEHNIALARRHGIFCLGFFMLGFPTETREELQATLDFAIRSKLHAANFFVVNPFEGTDLADQAKDMGKPVFGKFDDNYLSPGFTNLTDLPDAELQRIRRIGIVRFWLRPTRLWAALRDYPLKRRLPHMGVLMIKKLLLRG